MTLGHTGPPGARRDYEVLDLIEPSSGQGFVFRATLGSDRLGPELVGATISLKQLIAGAIGVDRIVELHDHLRARTHPHLSRQLEVFTGPAVTVDPEDQDADDLTYVAAVWVPGQTIDRAADGRPLSRLFRWVGHVAEAVDFLHADCHPEGPVLHRDIKPHNVIITPNDHAVLIDPGLARPVTAGATGTPHGSPGYTPPETRRGLGPSSAAGDRWQLGALAYALIVGEPPGDLDADHIRTRLRVALNHTHHPGALTEAMVAMLDPDPGNRPSSAADWASNLQTLEAQSRRPTSRQRAGKFAIRAGVAAAAVIAGLVGFVLHNPSTQAAHAAPRSGFVAPNSLLESATTPVSQPVTVYNKVTNGATLMREDTPAYLSTTPANFCKEAGCAVAYTNMVTGTEVTAVCQTIAVGTTNGDNTTTTDAHNRGRYTSDRWYGIRLPGGTFGYLSEVWLAVGDRGGLGLPQC